MTKGKLDLILDHTPRAVFKIGKLPQWMIDRKFDVKEGDEFVYADHNIRYRDPKTFTHIRTKSNYGIPLRHMSFVGYKIV